MQLCTIKISIEKRSQHNFNKQRVLPSIFNDENKMPIILSNKYKQTHAHAHTRCYKRSVWSLQYPGVNMHTFHSVSPFVVSRVFYVST